MWRSLYLWIVCSCFLFVGCEPDTTTDQADVLASMEGHQLHRAEVEQLIPRGASSADSLLLAESYVKKWVKEQLVYEVAERNLSDEKEEIDQLVEDYRRSLIRYRYQERLVDERLKTDISEPDKQRFYEENQKLFTLEQGLIKGLFLKIPVDAPGLSDVKKWYKSSDEAALEKIEKYSVQNATIYEYFYDKWVKFDEVMDNIPIYVSGPSTFLKGHKQVEVADSSYCYLLNIAAYLVPGQTEPYESASPRIVEMLVNQRKVEFLRNFEDELYNDAIQRGKVTFPNEP